jgi:2-oxoisovalerate dehydrogenase E1 component alpha subunit
MPEATVGGNGAVDAAALQAVQPSEGPELVQLLTPEGERVDHPHYRIDLSAEEYRELYRDLVLVRRIDTEAMALQRQGELGLWASLLGQEAAQVGAGKALTAGDFAFPTYREHGVAYCKGVDPVTLLGLFRGVNQGGWNPNDNGFQLYTIVIGSQTLHATGYAMGLQRDGADGAAMAFFGDGASSQGDVNEAFVWASVFAVARDALERAREGSGPTLIEAFTYRMGPHTTSDDPTRYRLAAELETWKLKDPIERMKAYLSRGGMADSVFFEQVERDADELAAHMRAGCLSLPDPDPLSLFDNVYAGGSSLLDEEREQLAGYLAGFEGADAGAGH